MANTTPPKLSIYIFTPVPRTPIPLRAHYRCALAIALAAGDAVVTRVTRCILSASEVTCVHISWSGIWFAVPHLHRYRNILPNLETRVFLESRDGDPVQEYINANHMFGRRFIASQGCAACGNRFGPNVSRPSTHAPTYPRIVCQLFQVPRLTGTDVMLR